MLKQSSARGFTLIEVLVVVTLVVILASIGMSTYTNSVHRTREAVLKEDLFRLRDAIDQYYADKGRYPESLETLTEQGYLRRIPVDPMTGNADWEVVPAEPDPDDPDASGIYDVKSSSTATATNGTAYNEW